MIEREEICCIMLDVELVDPLQQFRWLVLVQQPFCPRGKSMRFLVSYHRRKDLCRKLLYVVLFLNIGLCLQPLWLWGTTESEETKSKLTQLSPHHRSSYDGGPSMSMISSPQEGPKGSSLIGRLQEITQTCQENILFTHGFRSVHKPGFVHVISWPSSRHERVAGGLTVSSGHALSNKTNCRSFGGRLPPQISCWSQVLQTVSVLDSFGKWICLNTQCSSFWIANFMAWKYFKNIIK